MSHHFRSTSRCLHCVFALAVCLPFSRAEDFRPSQKTALAEIVNLDADIKAVNREIWQAAEVGLEEKLSSAAIIKRLRANGFAVSEGRAGMPTAFVASWGKGKPVIALLAEYDALPGLSQKATPDQDPVTEGAPGHGCGHSGLGAGSLGAAIAIKRALETHQIEGTIRLYGTPAEETTIGKVYLVLASEFRDVDICLHWHPSTRNVVWNGGSKALISAKFTFDGVAAHASGSPDMGRSALDAVELMNVGTNYLREHIREDARIHYVITDGGNAPNVVPAKATVWYFVRANHHQDVEFIFKWVEDIAEGAARMSRTKMSCRIDTDCHELIPNSPLAELVNDQFQRLKPPTFSTEEKTFAQRLQQPLLSKETPSFSIAIDDRIHPLAGSIDSRQGSTDVGDISWMVPTIGLRTTCFPYGSPGHCWQNVAAIGSSIGEKGTIYAAQLLAVSALELFEDKAARAAATADFRDRMKERKYSTLIPAGQQPPAKIR